MAPTPMPAFAPLLRLAEVDEPGLPPIVAVLDGEPWLVVEAAEVGSVGVEFVAHVCCATASTDLMVKFPPRMPGILSGSAMPRDALATLNQQGVGNSRMPWRSFCRTLGRSGFGVKGCPSDKKFKADR